MTVWPYCFLFVISCAMTIASVSENHTITAQNVELVLELDAPHIYYPEDENIPLAILVPVAYAQDVPERPFLDYTRVIKRILYTAIGVLVGMILIIVVVVMI